MTKAPKHMLLKVYVQDDIRDNKKMGRVSIKGTQVVVRPCKRAQKLIDRDYRHWLIERGIIRPVVVTNEEVH